MTSTMERCWHFSQYSLSNTCALYRSSQDRIARPNKYGNSFIDLLKIFRLFVVNGRYGRDKDIGSLSYISESRGSSLIRALPK